MKLTNLCLIGLNIFAFPTVALAESASQNNTRDRTYLVSQAEEEIETETQEDDPESKETKENDSEDDKSDQEKKKAEEEPTPEEISRLKKLATADQLYLSGYKKDAKKLYRDIKEIWELEKQAAKQDESIEPFDDAAKLSPAGKVFWRNYQKGKEQQLESKVVVSSLKLLTTREASVYFWSSSVCRNAATIRTRRRGEKSIRKGC